jgi:protein SCO1/2
MTRRPAPKIGRRDALRAFGGLGAVALAGLAVACRRRARDDNAPPPGAAAAGSGSGSGSEPHAPAGRVEPPALPPRISMLGADGAEHELAVWLQHRPTAIQLVFTRCTSTCPIQGALFAAVAPRLAHGARLLSVSIDPEHDTPEALRAWMARFGASPAWYAATPRTPSGVDALFDFLRGRAQGLDRHSLRAYLFDARGRLAYRTADLPPASEIIGALEALASA